MQYWRGGQQTSEPTTSFLSRDRALLIDGQWVFAASGKTFPVFNPATGTVMAQVAEADREDVDRAVKAARRAFDGGPWAKMTGRWAGCSGSSPKLIENHLEEFAELESIDNGKPLSVARVADVPLTVDMFRYMGGWTTKMTGTTIPWSVPNDFLSYTMRELVGCGRARLSRGIFRC